MSIRHTALDAARHIVRASGVILFAGAVVGCSFFGSNSAKPEPAELGANVPVVGVHQAWSATLGSATGEPLVPHVSGATVVVATSNGIVTAIDARTGDYLWRVDLSAGLAAGVGSDGRLAAVVSDTNEIIVLEAGQELWRLRLAAQIYTPPLVAGGRVFVLAADRTVAAFDAKSGRRLWSQARLGDPLVLRQSGVLMAVGDTLIAGMSGRLVGLNPDNGASRWEAPIASPRGTNDIERLVELMAPVSRVGDNVCVRAFQAAVGCVNTVDGSVVWTQRSNGTQGLDGDDEVIFGTQNDGVVVAWQRSDGTQLWSTERLRYRRLSAPLLLGRSVVVGDETGLVHLLSRIDGAPLNRLMTDGSGVASPPVLVADTLVVLTRKGNIYGFKPD